MRVRYHVQVIHVDHDSRVPSLSSSLAQEVAAIGLNRTLDLTVGRESAADVPTIAVYFGGSEAIADDNCTSEVEASLARGIAVIPVVDRLADFSVHVATALRVINGWEWSGRLEPGTELARLVLRALGIEEAQRSVFISHKREDGLLVAEQLFEALAKTRFDPFIDRFEISAGEDVQERIADALEERAFLLLLETPRAHNSDWVFDEVDYALSHAMGMHIVRWPGEFPEVPGSNRLPRQLLADTDLVPAKGSGVLTAEALDRVLEKVEAAHASAMVRRRRSLLCSVGDAATSAGRHSTPLPGWMLRVQGDGTDDLVSVTGRLPFVRDLWRLDEARFDDSSGCPSGLLVHASRRLPKERAEMLEWSIADRPLAMLPENAIGGYW